MSRVKRRTALVFALGAAGALAFAAFAFAHARSSVTVDFNKGSTGTNHNLGTSFVGGRLNVHTTTCYGTAPGHTDPPIATCNAPDGPGSSVPDQTNAGESNPSGYTKKAELWFDDDFQVNRGATTAKCDQSLINAPTTTMADAMAACGTKLVGSGTAKAVTNGGTYVIPACVLAFNGLSSTGEVLLFTRIHAFDPPPANTISCGSPASNTQGDAAFVLTGDLTAPGTIPGTGVADFQDPNNCSGTLRRGCKLTFNITNPPVAFPLTDFNVTTTKTTFVKAKCTDSPKLLNLRVRFSYKTGTQTEVKNASRACT